MLCGYFIFHKVCQTIRQVLFLFLETRSQIICRYVIMWKWSFLFGIPIIHAPKEKYTSF